MQFLGLTTSRFIFIEANSKSQAQKKFKDDLRKSGEWLAWLIESNFLTNTNTKNKMTDQVATIPDEEIVNRRKEAWGKLGIEVYEFDLKLQVRAQESIAKLTTPTTIGEVVKAEKTLKEVKAECIAIKNTRINLVKPINARLSQLMEPEKSFEKPTKDVETAIITLKREDEAKRRKENETLDAISNCKTNLLTLRNNAEAKFRGINVEKVNAVYLHALGAGEVEADMVDSYIDFAIKRRHAVEFDYVYPKNTSPLVSTEKFLELCVEQLTFDSKIYLGEYENMLKEKFSDYAVALKNKEEALKQAEAERQRKEAEIEANKANANVAAKLDNVAVTPVVTSGAKALKKSYEINMEETVESVITILTAFSAHIDKCLPKLNVSKWFSFTPKQAATALGKIKTDDNTFDHPGLIWKEVNKL